MRQIKRFCALVMTTVLIINMFSFAFAEKDLSLYINGVKVSGEYQPILSNNSSIAPIKVITKKLGAQIEWNGKTKTVTILNGNDTISLTINKKTVIRNGQTLTLTTAPKIINNSTYVPLRFVSKVLGYEVKWNGTERRIDIDSPSAVISQVKVENKNDVNYVLVNVDGDYNYSTFELTAPNRYVIDFNKAKIAENTLSIDVDSQYFTKVRTSQLSFDPLVARIVLDCTDKESDLKIEKVSDGLLKIYLKGENDPTVPVDPEEPVEPVEPPINVKKPSIDIFATGLKEYKIDSVFEEPHQPVYGVISKSKVNLRTEPSTADSDTVRATVDGGTKLQVIGQTFGWYNVMYKNEQLWVADWLLTLDLEMLRNNVNVRSAPGTSFSVIDTVLRGERIKVLERKPDWLLVETKSGKQGYIAEWLIGLNDRLVEGDHNFDNVAKELTFTLKNTNINHVTFGEKPSMVKSVSKKTVGSDVKVKLVLDEAIAYKAAKTDKGIKIDFGSALTSYNVVETDGRVTIDINFDLPVKFTVYQNFSKENLLLDFAYSSASKEGTKELNNNIAKQVEVVNQDDSSQLIVQLKNLGSYKVNTTGYSKTVQIVLLNSSLSGKIIAIDAGHGGTDSGATKYGILEKDLNLSVAKKVRDILVSKGVTVIMTRDTDKKMSLSERVDYVNGLNADIAISIHTNSSDSSKGSGVETLFYSKPENERLARCLQDGLVTATGFRSRGIKPWNWIYVTKNWKMPSALIEMGFITNASERQYLVSDKGQNAVAENVVVAIERFFMYK